MCCCWPAPARWSRRKDGPLVNELTTAGGEWIPMVNASINPLRLRRNARDLEHLIGHERIDIIHAYDAGAAWSARIATSQVACWLVTSLPDVPIYSGMRGRYAGALAQGDRVIAPSNYSAAPIVERYGLRTEQITIVPRVIDTATYDPAAVSTERADAQRERWRVAPDDRVVMVPGRVAPWNGQALLPEIARALVDSGVRGFVFVVVGEGTTHAKYARDVLKRAQAHGRRRPDPDDRALRRHAGGVRGRRLRRGSGDRGAAARAASSRRRRRWDGRWSRATSACSPSISSRRRACRRMCAPDGWRIPAIRPSSRRCWALALSLNASAYRQMSARARQFAEYMFSPESVADAMRSVYTSLLARDL